MTAAGHRQLTADRREDDPDFIAEPDQDRDGDDGDECED